MRLAILGLSIALMTAAHAQNRPEILGTQDTYNLAIGEATRLSFPNTFDRIELTTDTIVQVKPLTDRVISLQGLTEGQTIMTVFAGGKELYSASVIVQSEPGGHLIKLYGSGKNDEQNAGHVAVFCNQKSCGRPDRDLPRGNVEVRRVSSGQKDNPPPGPDGPPQGAPR